MGAGITLDAFVSRTGIGTALIAALTSPDRLGMASRPSERGRSSSLKAPHGLQAAKDWPPSLSARWLVSHSSGRCGSPSNQSYPPAA
jgi:hypothetical protein